MMGRGVIGDKNYNTASMCLLFFGLALILTGIRHGLWYYSQVSHIAEYSQRGVVEIFGAGKLFWEVVKGILGVASVWIGIKLRRTYSSTTLGTFAIIWGTFALLYGGYQLAFSAMRFNLLSTITGAMLVVFGFYFLKFGRSYHKKGEASPMICGMSLAFFAAYLSFSHLQVLLHFGKPGLSVLSLLSALLLFTLSAGLLAIGVRMRSGRNSELLRYMFYLLSIMIIFKGIQWLLPITRMHALLSTPYLYSYAFIMGAAAGLAYLLLAIYLLRLGRTFSTH